METLFDYIRRYQEANDCSDDDMLRILCDAIENGADNASGSIEGGDKIVDCIKQQIPLEESK